MSLLEVSDLRVRFDADAGTVRAVDGVSFDLDRGEVVCLVGESGSGKTVSCEALTKLNAPAATVEGEVIFDGTDLAKLPPEALEPFRGGRIGHVFQNPQGALDPVYTVGEQIVEAIRLHGDDSREAARERAIDLLDRVGIPEPATRVDDYPHQFSGGMRQRAVIAMALAPEPDLLVADEPTTALDVTIQADVLRLLRELRDDLDLGVLFVTHDLGVVAQVADRVVVTYAGKVMERGPVEDVFADPAHPYTRALLSCLPGRGDAMDAIGGSLPDPTDPPVGCRFHPRCPHAVPDCRTGDHPVEHPAGSRHHAAACVYYGEDRDPGELDGDPPDPGSPPEPGGARPDADGESPAPNGGPTEDQVPPADDPTGREEGADD